MDPKHQKIIDLMVHYRPFRLALGYVSHFWFFHCYFSGYVKIATAEFQKEILYLTERPDINNLVIAGFRGSSKSTLITLSYVIWSILGVQKKKFILIIGETEDKAQRYLSDLKEQFEKNELLRQDLGPFQQEHGQWRLESLILPKYGAMIKAKSAGQSVRGIKYKQYRPDVIILDDVENLEMVKTQESRDKTYEWLTSDVIPAGDQNTRMIFIGTPLHPDSLIPHFEKAIREENFNGVFRKYPFFGSDGRPLWPAKFPAQKEIDEERNNKTLNNPLAWDREFLLKPVLPGTQLIKREEIYAYPYDPEHPATGRKDYRFSASGADLAISKKKDADYTAVVSADICGKRKDLKIYIRPHPVCERLEPEEIPNRLRSVSLALGGGALTKVYVEEANIEKTITPFLKNEGLLVEAVPLAAAERTKEARLLIITAFIKSRKILFPEHGAEQLIEQVLGLGTGEHDDLADALTILVIKIIRTDSEYKDGEGFLEWMKEEAEKTLKNPLSGGSLTGWKRLADSQSTIIDPSYYNLL